MALSVYDDNEEVKSAFERAFARSGDLNARFVSVHLKTAESDLPEDLNGLNVALAFDTREGPIILYSAMTRAELAKDMRFNALLGRRGIGFRKTPFRIQAVVDLVDKLACDEKTEDLLAQKLVNGFIKPGLMSILRHALENAIGNESQDRIQMILKRARHEIGMTGPDETIIANILDRSEKPAEGMFPGQSFPGVFCDIEGTILLDGNQINHPLVDRLHDFEKEGQPVTLWTGGDVEELANRMILAELPWKVIPKQILAGSTVWTVFDDESYGDFVDKYNIQCEDFHRL